MRAALGGLGATVGWAIDTLFWSLEAARHPADAVRGSTRARSMSDQPGSSVPAPAAIALSRTAPAKTTSTTAQPTEVATTEGSVDRST